MVRRSGPVGATCPNEEVLSARVHVERRRATSSSSAAPTYSTRSRDLPPDEIALYTMDFRTLPQSAGPAPSTARTAYPDREMR